MDKYVNADDLKEQMVKYGWKHPDSTVHEFVDDMPAADVRENVHGKWILILQYYDATDGFTRRLYECDKCGKQIVGKQIVGARHYNFCPNCGADMRGEKDD